MKEVDGLGSEWAPSYDDLEEKLPYMDAVINESLRLYPPAFVTVRENEADLDLDGEPQNFVLYVQPCGPLPLKFPHDKDYLSVCIPCCNFFPQSGSPA